MTVISQMQRYMHVSRVYVATRQAGITRGGQAGSNVKMMYLGECGVGHPLKFSYVHKEEA